MASIRTVNQTPSSGTGQIFTGIKTDFLDKEGEARAAEAKAEAQAARERDDRDAPEGEQAKKTNKRKRKFGQKPSAKNRTLHFVEKDDLCRSYAVFGKCPYPSPCKRSHDLAGFLKTKKPDLGPKCYAFEKYGFCASGIRCRFGKSHITEDSMNIVPEGVEEGEGANEKDVSNVMTRANLFSLREKNNIRLKEWAKQRSQKQKDHHMQQLAQNKEQPEGAVSTTTPAAATTAPAGETGSVVADTPIRSRAKIDFKGKLVLAPLTTVGNLPFRRVTKQFGVDITVGEMALASNIANGNGSEWALLKRHKSEDVFGVQIAGNRAEEVGIACGYIKEYCNVDFVDLNLGCPIDTVCHKGMGAALMKAPNRVGTIVKSMVTALGPDIPVTVKMRTGYSNDKPSAAKIFRISEENGACAVMLHGRSRQARYTNLANWDFVKETAKTVNIPVVGNGDAYDYTDINRIGGDTGIDGLMVARGALIKPWVFTELKEQRHWDISSTERLSMLQDFANYGLEHWGSDSLGVANTRRFMLEWLSFLYRYVPVGIVEGIESRGHRMHHGVPLCFGRNDLETLMMSPAVEDWVKLTEMVLGPVEEKFAFEPKHRARSTPAGGR